MTPDEHVAAVAEAVRGAQNEELTRYRTMVQELMAYVATYSDDEWPQGGSIADVFRHLLNSYGLPEWNLNTSSRRFSYTYYQLTGKDPRQLVYMNGPDHTSTDLKYCLECYYINEMSDPNCVECGEPL